MANEFGLPPRQERFCQEYASDPKGNITAAALRAGYSKPGAAVEGSRNLRKPKIISRIKALRQEALEASGYDKELVRQLIMRRLTGIVSTHVTDIVHISPGSGDPNRQEVLDDLAAANGGQRVLDFGELLIVPTTSLTEEASGAIKKIKAVPATKESAAGVEVELNDVIAAAKLLAEITGIKEADTSVSVNISPALILEQVEARRRTAGAGSLEDSDDMDGDGGDEQE